jgi:hypothetical protein
VEIDGGLRGLHSSHLPMVHWQPVETGMTGRGVPDSNGCYRGSEFWVEMKWTPEWAVGLRPEQIGWLMRRSRAGGRVFVAVRQLCKPGARREARDSYWLFWGGHAVDLKERGLRGPPSVLTCGGGPARWDWPAILDRLTQWQPAQPSSP